MRSLLTLQELEDHFRSEVRAAGGAAKWCKKNKIDMRHAMHMIENGSAASLDRVLDALGIRRVTLYERSSP